MWTSPAGLSGGVWGPVRRPGIRCRGSGGENRIRDRREGGTLRGHLGGGLKIIGRPIEEAPTRMGLEVQFFCSADPAGWDPIYGKSPVHFAGNVHAKALKKAIKAHL